MKRMFFLLSWFILSPVMATELLFEAAWQDYEENFCGMAKSPGNLQDPHYKPLLNYIENLQSTMFLIICVPVDDVRYSLKADA